MKTNNQDEDTKVDLKILNVTFQSSDIKKPNPYKSPTGLNALTKSPDASKKSSTRLAADRIVGGKIFRALDRPSRVSPEGSLMQYPEAELTVYKKGALTQKLGKSSPRNLKLLRSLSKEHKQLMQQAGSLPRVNLQILAEKAVALLIESSNNPEQAEVN